MRSKTAKRILDETPQEVKDKVRLEGYKRWLPFRLKWWVKLRVNLTWKTMLLMMSNTLH
jgi:hypothetical protein